MPAVATIGALLERLVIQQHDAPSIAIASLTRASSTATVTTASPHGFATDDYVTIAGAVPAGYNGRVKVTVVSALVFTFTASAALSTPGSGTMTAVYVSDAQGGRAIAWTTVDTVPAELQPLRAMERLQVKAIGSQVDLRFRVRVRTDITPQMRVLWTPRWPAGADAQTLEIHGVLPFEDGRRWMLLECGALR